MGNAGITDSLWETLAVFESVGDPGEPMTTSEVADSLDVSRRSTYDRLERLVDHGLLKTKKAGSRGRVWWRPIETIDRSSGDSVPDSGATEQAVRDQVRGEREEREREDSEREREGSGHDGGDFEHDGRDGDGLEQAERERELEQYAALARAASDVILTIDTDSVVRNVNPAVADVFGYEPSELVGESLTTLMPEELEPNHLAAVDRYLADGERTLDWQYVELPGVRADGTEIPLAVSFSEYEVDGERYFTGIIRDDSERKEREREVARQREELETRERSLRLAYEVITDPERSFAEKLDDLLAVVRRALGTDYATLSRVQGDEYVFEAVAAPDDADLQVGDTVALSWTNCERVVETEQTLVLNDVDEDAPDLADRPGNADWGISCYLGSPVFVGSEVYGTFCFYDKEARVEDFSDWEIAFVDLLGNWVSSELERQQYTERITALNELNSVVREITDAVIEQSTREEIERVACEQLVAADAYEFAWTAEVDSNTREIRPRTEAGIDGFLENIELSADADQWSGQGPAGKTFRTGETEVSRDVFEDPDFEPWRDNAERYGFRSFAAIPLVHGETLYGVLGVYSARSGAFAENERNVLRQLGEVIGHTIAAVERQRALMGDELVELEFRLPGPLEAAGVEMPSDGRITLAGTVPVGGDDYVVYGTASPGTAHVLEALVDANPHWDGVAFYGADGTRFELRLSDSRVHSTLAALGGYVESTVLEGEEFRTTLHLPTGVEVRQVIDAVDTMYPGSEMVKRRQITRPRDADDRVHSAFAEGLTDRQRATLRAAYYAGFFEWPRETSGEEVAASLDVSPPTFHQHLRKAEQKVFESLLSGPL